MDVSMNTLASYVFFAYPPPAEIDTLSLHDALPISRSPDAPPARGAFNPDRVRALASSARILSGLAFAPALALRSEEHTSELQSRRELVFRLLLEKKIFHYLQSQLDSSRSRPRWWPTPLHQARWTCR